MGKSSKDKRDAYYRLAKEQGWRARSAFKLLQLDEQFNLFHNVTRVVDLCAAPGSWSQVLSRILIKGECFGREAWEDQQAKDRLELFGIGLKGQERAKRVEEEKARREMEMLTLGEEGDGKVRREGRKDVKIVAVDLQPMSPLEGIVTLQADITHPSTIPKILRALDPEGYDPTATEASQQVKVDLVISDGAPDVTGLHDLDIYVQSQLLWAALNLALCVLKPGGKFVAKIFRAKDCDLLYWQLRIMFERVTVAKPRSSRASSIEAFVVCENFQPPAGFKASLENPLGGGNTIPAPSNPAKTPAYRHMREDGVTVLELGSEDEGDDGACGDEGGDTKWIAPFLATGDLSSWDSDATYKLPEDRVVLDPVQPPTAPPYRRALEMRKRMGGAYGKTKLGGKTRSENTLEEERRAAQEARKQEKGELV
jgi:tRNA (cytidine32/guanosine34-2'-O)-methyltransferase